MLEVLPTKRMLLVIRTHSNLLKIKKVNQKKLLKNKRFLTTRKTGKTMTPPRREKRKSKERSVLLF